MFIFLSRNFNNSFRLSIKNDLGLLSVGFTSPCNCWKKFAPPSQPIKCKNKTNPNLFASVFSKKKKKKKKKMNGANFLTCSQGLNCGGTREVRSDVSILKAPLAAASVHCDHTSPTQTYDGTNRDRPQHRALRALCVKLVASLFFQFSLVNNHVNPYSEWQLRLIWFWFFDTIKNCSISTIINCKEKNTWVTLTS